MQEQEPPAGIASAIAARHGLELLVRIGAGGMGEVFLARRLGAAGFQKPVVVKRLPPDFTGDSDFTRALIHEAKVMVRLNHPGIVQVYDLIAEQDEYLLVLEYVEGYSLREVIAYLRKEDAPPPVETAVAITASVAESLDYAHSLADDDGTPQGVVHCDVSPDNILISRRGEVKLTDFGIARAHHATSQLDREKFTGKVRYLAPEQLSQGPLHPTVDVFSLAYVLYELLTLRFAREGAKPSELISSALAADPTELPRDIQGYLPELAATLRRATAPDPRKRHPDANALLTDLRSLATVRELDLRPAQAIRPFAQDLYRRDDFPLSGRRLPRLSDLSALSKKGSRAATPLATTATALAGVAVPTSPTKRAGVPDTPVILLVDDSDIIRGLLENSLPRYGIRVVSTGTGNAALDWLGENRCDAVVADLNMPDLSGLELCSLLRANPVTAHIPVLLLTSETDSSRAVTGLGVGAADYIRKGVSEAEIAARIHATLRRR